MVKQILVSISVAVTGMLFPFALMAQNGGAGGVLIDSKGVLSPAPGVRRSEALSQTKLAALAKSKLAQDLNRKSELRFVSLPKLERACEQFLTEGKELPDEIRYLAGLQKISHVIFDDESQDIIIAGPADGFAPNALQVMVGIHSLRPVLHLDDLLVVLRSGAKTIGCSIDPDQTQLAHVNRFLQQAGAAASIAGAKARYRQMAKMLGHQPVRVWGVPADSHFAHILVEADYRMKRISVGQEKPRIPGLRSYLQTKGAGTNSMRRWWFAAAYDVMLTTEDRSVWRLSGQRVQLKAQDELVMNNGRRRDTNSQKPSTQAFARQFTEKYTALSEKSTVFAELQNLFDMSIAIGIMRQENMSTRAGWGMKLFSDQQRLETETYSVAKFAPSISASKQVGRDIVIGVVGGGVRIDPGHDLKMIRIDVDQQLADLYKPMRKQREKKATNNPDRVVWWWDKDEK